MLKFGVKLLAFSISHHLTSPGIMQLKQKCAKEHTGFIGTFQHFSRAVKHQISGYFRTQVNAFSTFQNPDAICTTIGLALKSCLLLLRYECTKMELTVTVNLFDTYI